MKLLIFDIDGTLIDSVKTDDSCFKTTFQNLYNIDISETNWTSFKHVTDLGLTIEIFNKWLNRLPTNKDIFNIKAEFYKLLNSSMNECVVIKNAVNFINYLSKSNDYQIAFATGGWKETAILKCNHIGINLNQFVLKSSNNHFDRAIITELAIASALEQNGFKKFNSVTYFGDGLWDLKNTKYLGINFIGVDYKHNNKILNAGHDKIIHSYDNVNSILNLIQ